MSEIEAVHFEQGFLGRKWCPLHGRTSKYNGFCWHCVSIKCDAEDRILKNRMAPMVTKLSPMVLRMTANRYAMALYPRHAVWEAVSRETGLSEQEIQDTLSTAGYDVIRRRPD